MAPGGKGLIHTYFFPVGFGVTMVACVTAMNYRNIRPMWSGLHQHFAAGIVGVIMGVYADKFWRWRWSERDASVRHYIELHPEDFVDTKRKYKEVFSEWYPQR